MHKYNILKQGKLFYISDIKYGLISYLKSISEEEKDILCKLKACSKNNYFNIGYKFFTLKDEVLKVKNIIIENYKDTNYNLYIKFDNEAVINSSKIEEYLYYTNKWYKEKIITDSDYKISANIYEKFYEYPISVVISFINSLWLSNTDKRDNFNFFVLNNTIKDLVEYYCYNKTFFGNIMLKNDYEAYYINAGKQILEEDLMYFTNVMRYTSKYELPEYFKSKYNKDNKNFKKEDFKIKNNTINSKEDGKQEFKSRENRKNGRSENQLQRENTAKSYYRFAKRSKLFGGRYQSSITDENAFSKERTSKNKSVLRNS